MSFFFFISFKINWSLYWWHRKWACFEIELWNRLLFTRCMIWFYRCVVAAHLACTMTGLWIFLFMKHTTHYLFFFIISLHIQDTFIFAFRIVTINIIYHLISLEVVVFLVWKYFGCVSGPYYLLLLIFKFQFNFELPITIDDIDIGHVFQNRFVAQIHFLNIFNYILSIVAGRRCRHIVCFIFKLKLTFIHFQLLFLIAIDLCRFKPIFIVRQKCIHAWLVESCIMVSETKDLWVCTLHWLILGTDYWSTLFQFRLKTFLGWLSH